MALLEILEIERTPFNPDVLWGAAIDAPLPGARQSHFGLIVGGWVLHRDTEIVDVVLTSDGMVIARWRANRVRTDVATAFNEAPVTPACGYLGVIGALALPPSFELRVDAIAPARPDRPFKLGVIRGRRSPLTGAPEDGEAQPAMVTTLGRTGSTLLLHLLAQHPAVVAHPPFPYEARVATYWASICEGLSAPSSYLQALAAVDDRRFWWTGYNSFGAETYVDQDSAARWLGGSAVEETARFARRQTLDFYRASAAMQNKPAAGPRWFAEKRLPHRRLQIILSELFPAGREIHLVRDFRDMLASIFAFNQQRGHEGFGKRQGEDYVDTQAESVRVLLQSWRLAGSRNLVRYEDLIREPRPTLARALADLGLDASQRIVDGILDRAQHSSRAAQLAHRTSPDAKSSIGRWQRDLTGELGERCGEVFAEALAEFGYQI